MPSYHSVILNPLLACTPADHRYYSPVPIFWDVRYAPSTTASNNSFPNMLLSSSQLAQPATSPSVPNLQIKCDLMTENWPITVYNPTGVTVLDVLEAIHTVVRAPLQMHEWESLKPKQQHRIGEVFDSRWRTAQDQWRVRSGGVKRVDCLLSTTIFEGLSSLTHKHDRWIAVLTLSRNTRV
ncbi:hypothetical protein BV22DRAFT_1036767 [Leucogyrophana mollusca]|uniref:Uncharacterized protein n=1 Tax=Leucogyrophana mollusca TaxID=85980 RepID=A0ACB8BE75_9AGAM|nr:hypothetical protein BV22DRAFT_1036767 [Leucogyrophana mollusca]